MRYIFYEWDKLQIVFDNETYVQYEMDIRNFPYFRVSHRDASCIEYFYTYDRAISRWRRLALYINRCCETKNAKRKMIALVEGK